MGEGKGKEEVETKSTPVDASLQSACCLVDFYSVYLCAVLILLCKSQLQQIQTSSSVSKVRKRLRDERAHGRIILK